MNKLEPLFEFQSIYPMKALILCFSEYTVSCSQPTASIPFSWDTDVKYY